MVSFESDYIAGAHPEVLEKLVETNLETLTGYGFDKYSDSAKEKIKKAIGIDDVQVEFRRGIIHDLPEDHHDAGYGIGREGGLSGSGFIGKKPGTEGMHVLAGDLADVHLGKEGPEPGIQFIQILHAGGVFG